MLNINQNFDLKAPVFNFDRDYFNSVEELEAYDTSNVPDHFVTNVAGMLYQFTDGQWLPMIGTALDDPENQEDHEHYVNLIDKNCYVSRNTNSSKYTFRVAGENTIASISNEPGIYLYTDIDDAAYPRINLTQETGEIYKYIQLGITDDGPFGLDIQNKTNGNIQILTDAIITDEDEEDGCSLVDISLTENNNRTHINAKGGFFHKTDDGYKTSLNAYQLRFSAPQSTHTSAYFDDGMISYERGGHRTLWISGGIVNNTNPSGNGEISFGEDQNFKFSRPTNDEGGVISGIKSLTAFANPSATKVWATDGSTINMPTKFSDLKNDSVYITGNKGETDAKFKIHYKDGDVLRSRLEYRPRTANTGISELALASYDVSGNSLSQIRIRPEDNKDDGQYLIQIQDARGNKLNCVSTLYPNGFQHQNLVDNISVKLDSNELGFYTGYDDTEQAQLKITKDGITKTNGKATEVFAADGSIVDLTTKANTSDLDAKANASDVLLKKSADGGYYIESNSHTLGQKAFAANDTCTASGANSCAVGLTTTATATGSYAEGSNTHALGWYSHSEGTDTASYAIASHAEGIGTGAIGYCSHTQGSFNVVDNNSIHSVGIGNNTIRKNAEYIYAKNNSNNTSLVDDPKNGYKYLIGVGGYDGISTDNTTYKSVQEVIADLTARIEQLETKVKALEDANTPA